MEKKKTIKIVILEDDLYYNKTLTKYVSTLCNSQHFPACNFEISSYLNAQDCLEHLEKDTSILLLDYFLFDPNELETVHGDKIVSEVHAYCDNCKIIVISEQSDVNVVAELVRKGIYEYVDKKTNNRDRVGSILQRAIQSLIEPKPLTA